MVKCTCYNLSTIKVQVIKHQDEALSALQDPLSENTAGFTELFEKMGQLS